MTKQWLIPACLVALLGGGPVLAAETGHDHNAAPAATQAIPATGTVKSLDAAAQEPGRGGGQAGDRPRSNSGAEMAGDDDGFPLGG